ncbi:MAG: hypothetical protein U0637_09785 [Phycisphaerales bacterium]
MGLLGKLFGALRSSSAAGGEPDRVWWSRVVCNRAVLADVRAARAAGARVLVLAHFEETLLQLRAADGGGGVFGDDEPLMLVRDAVSGARGASAFQLVLVAERHPLRSEDDAVAGWVGAGGAPKVAFYVALDDALLRLFGGDRTRELLGRLGMKEEDPIEHPFIDRSLRNAQEKVAARALGKTLRAGSAGEWLRQAGMHPDGPSPFGTEQ